jgi:hypothetical protein
LDGCLEFTGLVSTLLAFLEAFLVAFFEPFFDVALDLAVFEDLLGDLPRVFDLDF